MSTEKSNIIELSDFDVYGVDAAYDKAGLGLSLDICSEAFGSDQHDLKFSTEIEYPRTVVQYDELLEIQAAGDFLQGFDPSTYEWGVDPDRDADIEWAQEILGKFDLDVEDVHKCTTVEDYDYEVGVPALFEKIVDAVYEFSKLLKCPVQLIYPWGDIVDSVIIEPGQHTSEKLENVGSLDELLDDDCADESLRGILQWSGVDVSYT